MADSESGRAHPSKEPQKKPSQELIDKVWEMYLTTGDVPKAADAPWYHDKRLRPWIRRLPSEPRCRLCYYPFEGIGGAIFKHMLGVHPSKVNPYFCNKCELFAEKYTGGAEVEVTVLFADVRGSTTLAESMKPAEYSQLIKRFYRTAASVMFDTNAIVEKLVGDAVTGFYTSGFSKGNHAEVAVEAARRILRDIGCGDPAGPWVPVGIGVHTGIAYVGTVKTDSNISNIAILGDTANTGARLAALAGPGEIYVSQATIQKAGLTTNGLQAQHLTLKGRTQPVDAFVLSV